MIDAEFLTSWLDKLTADRRVADCEGYGGIHEPLAPLVSGRTRPGDPEKLQANRIEECYYDRRAVGRTWS